MVYFKPPRDGSFLRGEYVFVPNLMGKLMGPLQMTSTLVFLTGLVVKFPNTFKVMKDYMLRVDLVYFSPGILITGIQMGRGNGSSMIEVCLY